MTDRIESYVLEDSGDERGHAWQLGDRVRFLGGIEDVHVMTLDPGHVRGNHFHRRKREILIVEHEDTWALHWEDGTEDSRQERMFAGQGAVVVLVPPGCAHALENRGEREMRVVSISDRPYDPISPDAHLRILRKID